MDETKIQSMDTLIGEHVNLGEIKKIGEGTFGEAFKGGKVVFKIVPMDGSLLVNGEVQKRSEEIYAEVSVALTLSELRIGKISKQDPRDQFNTSFALLVFQYDRQGTGQAT